MGRMQAKLQSSHELLMDLLPSHVVNAMLATGSAKAGLDDFTPLDECTSTPSARYAASDIALTLPSGTSDFKGVEFPSDQDPTVGSQLTPPSPLAGGSDLGSSLGMLRRGDGAEAGRHRLDDTPLHGHMESEMGSSQNATDLEGKMPRGPGLKSSLISHHHSSINDDDDDDDDDHFNTLLPFRWSSSSGIMDLRSGSVTGSGSGARTAAPPSNRSSGFGGGSGLLQKLQQGISSVRSCMVASSGVGGSHQSTSSLPLLDIPMESEPRYHHLAATPSGSTSQLSVSVPPNRQLSEAHESVTIFFSDLIGFSTWAHTLPPERVMVTLNDLYSRLDDIIVNEMPSLYKVSCYTRQVDPERNKPRILSIKQIVPDQNK